MVKYYGLFNVFDVFSCEIGDPHVFSRSVIKVAEGFSVTLHLLALNRTCALIKKNKNNINSKFFSKILPKLIAKILIFLLFKLVPSFGPQVRPLSLLRPGRNCRQIFRLCLTILWDWRLKV